MLSSEAVIRAGVESVREHGLPSLSIRSLAERLGVTPMALYRHVEKARALEEAVVDEILSRVAAVPGEGDWEFAARAWAAHARPVFAAHPGVARYVLTRWFLLPRVLDWIEALLAAAERGGMVSTVAVSAVNAIFTYVLMRAEAEEAIVRAGVVHRKLPQGKKSQARWPRLKANAAEYEVARMDSHFAYGLDVLLLGIDRRNHANP